MVAEQAPLHSRILLHLEPGPATVTIHAIAIDATLAAQLERNLQVQKNPTIGWTL